MAVFEVDIKETLRLRADNMEEADQMVRDFLRREGQYLSRQIHGVGQSSASFAMPRKDPDHDIWVIVEGNKG